MSFVNNQNQMQKRGQFIELVGIVLIIGIAVVGTTVVYLQRDSVYVGEITTGNLYSYSECKNFIQQLGKDDLVIYDENFETFIKCRDERCMQ